MEFQYEKERIFACDEAGKVIAEITFPVSQGVADINHTFVDGSLRGQGVAGRLTEAAVASIRAQGLRAPAARMRTSGCRSTRSTGSCAHKMPEKANLRHILSGGTGPEERACAAFSKGKGGRGFLTALSPGRGLFLRGEKGPAGAGAAWHRGRGSGIEWGVSPHDGRSQW